MKIFNVFQKAKKEKRVREVVYYRAELFPETLQQLYELKQTLNKKEKKELEKAHFWRKIIGLAYHDLIFEVQKDGKNSRSIKNHRTFIQTEGKKEKKKIIKNKWQKRAI